MKFWRKCGKIIADGSKLIRCDVSPCGYWAVFGIKYRSVDQQTLQPYDNCSWYHQIFVSEVIQGAIDWYGICLKVEAKQGLCLQKKGRWNCYQQCWDWDQETGDCIYQEFCDAYQFKVYNLSGCYNEYQKFAEAYYSMCDRQADDQGNYPQIFRQWYGSIILTGDAEDCLGEWESYFNQRYCLNFTLTYNNCWQRWWYWVAEVMYDYETYYYCSQYSDCWDWADQPDEQGKCPNDMTLCSESYQGQMLGFGSQCYEQGGITSGYSQITTYMNTEDDFRQWCCAQVGAKKAIPQMNECVFASANKPENYYINRKNTLNCYGDDRLCANFEYQSGCVDNWYAGRTTAKINFNLYKCKLSRNENTPEDAVGVRFKVKKIHIQENKGKGHQSYKETESAEIWDLYFDGEQKVTDLALDVTPFGVLKSPTCNENCQDYTEDSPEWQIQPFVMFSWGGIEQWQQNNKFDRYKYEIVADQYIYGEN